MSIPQALEVMLNELESHCLRVELVPLNPRMRNWNEMGMKRVVTDEPPKWYRRLCQSHTSSRAIRRGKHDTRIRRANVLSLLRVLTTRGRSWSKYADEILAIAGQLADRKQRCA